jgi:hypothetical protein
VPRPLRGFARKSPASFYSKSYKNGGIMEKKLPVGLSIVGGVIILSNAISLLSILPLGFADLLPLDFIWIIQLFSMDISGIGIYFPSLLLFRVVKFILLASTILVGVGLLKLKNLARIAIVILSSINVIQNIFFLYASNMPKIKIAATEYIDLLSIVEIFISIFYIIYFTRPKVKEQFK